MEGQEAKVCAECGEPAVVFATWVKTGECKCAAYCEKHAGLAGLADAHGYDLVEHAEESRSRRADTSLRCPSCDCSLRDFERQGRFGCPACYTTFAGPLGPLLVRMHRGVEHRGKIPLRKADAATVRDRIARLQEELKDAVRTESFEGAARTRDAIEALKAKLLLPATGSEKLNS